MVSPATESRPKGRSEERNLEGPKRARIWTVHSGNRGENVLGQLRWTPRVPT